MFEYKAYVKKKVGIFVENLIAVYVSKDMHELRNIFVCRDLLRS